MQCAAPTPRQKLPIPQNFVVAIVIFLAPSAQAVMDQNLLADGD